MDRILIICHYNWFKAKTKGTENIVTEEYKQPNGPEHFKIDIRDYYTFIAWNYLQTEDRSGNSKYLSELEKKYRKNGREILIFAHAGHFDESDSDLVSLNIRFFHSFNEREQKYACEMDEFVANLVSKVNDYCGCPTDSSSLPSWEDIKRFFLPDLTLYLSPLYISLQAFWGITDAVKEDNTPEVQFVRLSNKENAKNAYMSKNDREIWVNLPEVPKEMHDSYKELFPNEKAFLLVKDAKYDFYAPLFDMVMSSNENGEGNQTNEQSGVFTSELETRGYAEENLGKNAYEVGTIQELIESFDEYEALAEAFGECVPDKWEKINLKERAKEVKTVWFKINYRGICLLLDYHLFIGCLRELCAILANAEYAPQKDADSRGNKNYFQYQGKYTGVRKKITDGMGEKDFGQEHSKMEKGDGYRILVHQISKWGIEKSMVVLGGIAVLGRGILQSRG